LSRHGFIHRRFLLLLLIFIVGVLVQQAVLPVMEGGDEYLHYNYIQYLLRENRLPDRSTFLSNSMQQQSGQPPLVYWMAALLMRLANLPADDDAALWQRVNTHKNPWYAAPDQWQRQDNRNLFFHGERSEGNQVFETPTIAAVDRVIRFTGLFFGILAVIGAYGAASEIFPQQSWALTAAAIFAFTPQMVHISSFTNTDSGMIAFSALTTWATLRLLRLGATPRRCLLLGILLGFAGLSKITGLLVAPAVGVPLLCDAYFRKRPVRQFIVNGVLVAVPLALLFGPWIVYGQLMYGDPIGTNTHLRPGYFYDQPLNLLEIVPLLPEIYLGYWGKLASAIYLHPFTYTMLGTLLLLSIFGYGLWLLLRHHISTIIPVDNLQIQQLIVLAVIILCSIAGLVHWLQTIHFITGRLMFQAHTAVAIVITGGLYLLAKIRPRSTTTLQIYAVGLMVAAGVLLTPMSIYAAYVPPPLLSPEQLPTLAGNPVDFDRTIRFLGVHQDSIQLTGNTHTVTLCWEVLKAAERPAAFSIKIVRDGQIIGDRTSVHGLGRYDSGKWNVGDIFCDTVTIPITGTVERGQTYQLLLVLLDARTQAVDWQATSLDGTPIQYPFIGEVVAPGG
jgi:4-amino-4-deoxy-L-arabinose transferase-like glycosyltransferase